MAAAKMSDPKFPAGWDEARIQRVIAHHGRQTEEEAVAEDEALPPSSETLMIVPHELVPQIRQLIAKHQSR